MPSDDEVEPHWSLLEAVVDEVLVPALTEASAEIGEPYRARIAVWVRDVEIVKFSITPANRYDHEDINENVDVRIRFRRTLKPTRLRFSIQAQIADAWREGKLRGFRMAGDIDVSKKVPFIRLRHRHHGGRFTGTWSSF